MKRIALMLCLFLTGAGAFLCKAQGQTRQQLVAVMGLYGDHVADGLADCRASG